VRARDFVGLEHLSLISYDDPPLVHEMMEHMTVFIMEVYDRALREVGADGVMLSEGMA
jgi:hypothetical protein